MKPNSATSRKATTRLGRIPDLLSMLHQEIAYRLLEGNHDRWSDKVADLADRLWIEAQRQRVTPHLCTDRYCDCHVALWQGEPPQLPLHDL